MDRRPEGRADGIELVALCAGDTDCAGSIGAIWERAWKVDPSPEDLQVAARKVAEEIGQIDPDRKALIVARNQCQTIGFCRVAADAADGSLWWVRGVAVHEDWHSRGIGTDLLLAGVTYAAEHGAAFVRSTTDPWNHASVRCHEKAGFRNEGEFVAEDGDRKVGFSVRTNSQDPPPSNHTEAAAKWRWT